METEHLNELLFEALISGDRPVARSLIDTARQNGATPADLITDVFWPTSQLLDKLHRDDQLARLNHHLGTRLLRVLVDQNAAALLEQSNTTQERTVFMACGATEQDELGAQLAADMLEASGFAVRFAGGGIAFDEILGTVNDARPDVLCMFCSAAPDLPDIRQLIDTIREIGACSDTQIAVGGGVFNRAPGLAEEIGADVWASDPLDLAEVLIEGREDRATADQRTVGKGRRKRAA